MIEPGVADRLFVERKAADLPSPDDQPAVGITNDGLYQYVGADAGWKPFPWSSVFDVGEDGETTLGTRSDPVAAVDAATIDGVLRARPGATSGAGTKADPFVLPEDLLESYDDTVAFGPGWFETSGLATPEEFPSAETSVYLAGEGVRTSTLLHAEDAPSTPTVHFRGAADGNFGGVRDMTVYGAGEGEAGVGSAPIVRSDGGIIDLQFENVIIRYGGGDVLHLEHSSSGTRVQNAWLENSSGWGLYLGGGSRQKVNGVHILGTEGGIHTEGTGGNFSDLTITYARGHTGIRSTSSRNNFSNVILRKQLDRGVELYGTDTTISNVFVEETNRAAFLVSGMAAISNVVTMNCGADGESVFTILGDGTTLSNAWVRRTGRESETSLLDLDASRCHVDGLGGDPGEGWGIRVRSGATENVVDGLYGVSYADVSDDGTRTLVNRWGTNDGDPSVEGEWNDYADYAGMLGATIWDTSRPSWRAHRVSPNGDWVTVGG